MRMPEKVRLSVDVIRHLRAIPDGSPRRVEDLAIIFGTSKNFLHQVVSHLSRAGMVSVIKGPRGGVASNITEHNLLEIYQLFGYMSEPVVEGLPSADIEKDIRVYLAGLTI
jgi:DNA-binding IscR family transcriptional regulator